jgi:hypothetical protein
MGTPGHEAAMGSFLDDGPAGGIPLFVVNDVRASRWSGGRGMSVGVVRTRWVGGQRVVVRTLAMRRGADAALLRLAIFLQLLWVLFTGCRGLR